MTTLVNEDVAEIFMVPVADWRAIQKQAKAVTNVPEAVAVSSDVLESLPMSSFLNDVPPFPPLRLLFVRWRASTYPSILAHAAEVGRYAEESIAEFSAAGGDPMMLLRSLHERTTAIAAQFAPVAAELDELRRANAAVESYLADHPDIEDIWRTIAPRVAVTGDIAGKVGHVEGTWRALADDLAAVGDGAAVPLLAALEVEAAIAAWTRIRTEAATFLANQA